MNKVEVDQFVYCKVLETKVNQEMTRANQMEALYLSTKAKLDELLAKEEAKNEVNAPEQQ